MNAKTHTFGQPWVAFDTADVVRSKIDTPQQKVAFLSQLGSLSAVSKQSPVISEASTWFDLGCVLQHLGYVLQDAGRHQESLFAFTQALSKDRSAAYGP